MNAPPWEAELEGLTDEEAARVVPLGPHLDRPIRAFLRDRNVAHVVESAFWHCLYGPRALVDHATAEAVAAELAECARPVRDVALGGWKPAALIEAES